MKNSKPEVPPEWTKGPVRRPVDMSEEFKENGWDHCKYLITDPRSDKYLQKHKKD